MYKSVGVFDTTLLYFIFVHSNCTQHGTVAAETGGQGGGNAPSLSK